MKVPSLRHCLIAPLPHCLIALVLFASIASAQQPNTATISGTVVTDETPPRPVRRAMVTLAAQAAGRGGGPPTSTVTDDQGRFAFAQLAAGRYTLTAAKPSYVNGSYGATRPARPGTVIQLTAGQQLPGATIKLTRGAVVTGTVRDQNGDPMSSARVSLLRYVYQPQNGERVLQPQPNGGTTDDRGVYRIYGVTPGEYYAQLESPFILPGEVRQTTPQSMQAARRLLQAPAGSADAAAAQASDLSRPVGYAPIFYPAATSADNAEPLKLAAGEERAGVDIQFRMVPTARIEGVVLGPDGAPAPNASVSVLGAGPMSTSFTAMFSMVLGGGRPDAQGRFTLPSITPGRYTVAARTGGPGRGGAAPATPPLWATAEVDVNGQDISGVRLSLEPGLRVSGRIAFEGPAPTQDITGARVSLTPILSGSSVAVITPPVQPDAQGRFTFDNVTPGRYRWGFVSPQGAGAWTVKSATSRNRETIDAGLDVQPGEPVGDVVLTMSDRTTTIEGTLQDASGRPAADYFIVVYAKDRALQTPPTRRVTMARPSNDGRFAVRDLPPGEYLLAATTDLEQGEWRDPAFLAQLVTASIPVTLAEGETKRQDIRIQGQ
jgi:hypothetical protein